MHVARRLLNLARLYVEFFDLISRGRRRDGQKQGRRQWHICDTCGVTVSGLLAESRICSSQLNCVVLFTPFSASFTDFFAATISVSLNFCFSSVSASAAFLLSNSVNASFFWSTPFRASLSVDGSVNFPLTHIPASVNLFFSSPKWLHRSCTGRQCVSFTHLSRTKYLGEDNQANASTIECASPGRSKRSSGLSRTLRCTPCTGQLLFSPSI